MGTNGVDSEGMQQNDAFDLIDKFDQDYAATIDSDADSRAATRGGDIFTEVEVELDESVDHIASDDFSFDPEPGKTAVLDPVAIPEIDDDFTAPAHAREADLPSFDEDFGASAVPAETTVRMEETFDAIDEDLAADEDVTSIVPAVAPVAAAGAGSSSAQADHAIPPIYDKPRPLTDSAPDEAKRRRRFIGGVAAAAVCAVALGAGVAAATSSPQDTPSRPVVETQASEVAEEAVMTQEASVAQAEVAPAEPTSAAVRFVVTAPRYDATSSAIIYHIQGTPDDGGEDIDMYGAVTPGADVSVELPFGVYSIDWSGSILSDGSFFKVPDRTTFTVDTDAVNIPAVFQVVDAEVATAEEVKAAYEELALYLEGARNSEVSERIDFILGAARANANMAPAVAAVGGLDRVGLETAEEETTEDALADAEDDQATDAADSGTDTPADQAVVTDDAASADATPAYTYTPAETYTPSQTYTNDVAPATDTSTSGGTSSATNTDTPATTPDTTGTQTGDTGGDAGGQTPTDTGGATDTSGSGDASGSASTNEGSGAGA